MLSDFATARHHLKQAQYCLRGDDNVTDKMLTALSLLIDAALMAEHTQNQKDKVVTFPPVGAERSGLRWTVKKPLGIRGGSQPSTDRPRKPN